MHELLSAQVFAGHRSGSKTVCGPVERIYLATVCLFTSSKVSREFPIARIDRVTVNLAPWHSQFSGSATRSLQIRFANPASHTVHVCFAITVSFVFRT